MSIINGTKIVSPVGVEDVRRVLGEASTDIGTLCTSDKINRWAKFKPYAVNQIAPISDAQRKAYSYGIKDIPYFRYGRGMVSFINDGSPAPDNGLKPEYFTYEKPSAVMRLTDFDGYYHDATEPLTAPTVDSITPSNAEYTVLTFPTNPRGPEVIDLSDLTLNRSGASIDLATHYMGAIISGRVITQAQPVSQYSGSSVYIPTTELETLSGKHITVCAFLSPEIRTSLSQPDTAPNNALFIPLTWTKKQLFVNYRPAIISGSVAGWYNNTSDKYINVTYSLKNESSTPCAVTGIQIVAYGTGGTELKRLPINDVTIASGQTVTNTVQLTCTPLSAKYVSIFYTVAGTTQRLTGGVSQGAPQ